MKPTSPERDVYYVHGYTSRESIRLQDQASTLTDLLHGDTAYPPGSLVLEAGCGVGAQTVMLARNSPEAEIISIDVSRDSLTEAMKKVQAAGFANVRFQQADILALPFAPEFFDHVFVCFVLEHLPCPTSALLALKKVLKPGGTITVIEGDHGSAYFSPQNELAMAAIQCLIRLQREGGGDALVGRQLYPLLTDAGFEEVHVSPRMVYADASRPAMVEGFIRKTFAAMIEGVRDEAIRTGIMTAGDFDAGIRALYRTAERDGVFCYTFFKALGRREQRNAGGDHVHSQATQHPH